MTDTTVENSGSFSDPSQAARLRDLISGLVDNRINTLTPTRMTGMILDIYQGGPTFNSDITVESTIIPRTQDNPERPYVALIRLDDKFEGGTIEARIDPNLIPIFRKAEFFDEDNPAGSGTMVDRAGRYITVAVTEDGSAPVDDTYPSLIGTTLQAPQVAPRVALVGSAASWRVSELIRGVLAIQTNPATLMLGPDYARFDTNTLTWGGTIAFARGSEIKAYEIYPDAPIVTYGSEPLEVSPTEPVEIVLGQRSGSMYLNFSATDGVPVLVWVEAGSDTPIPPEWYLVFARINDGDLSSKLVFSSLTDFRSPSAPDNLVLTYAKTGYEKLGLTASWNEVVEGTNGDPISISGYELWGMLNEEDWRRITTTTDTHVAGLTFDSSSEWHFKVRAMGQNGIPGVFSDVEAVTFPEETEVIGGGSKTYWQPDKPIEGNPGDEWFDTNDGNAHYIFDEVADDYVAAPFGSGALDEYVNNLINTAVSDAASASENAGLAITAANGKNTIFIQAAKPSLTGRVLGDTWFDTDDGNKIYSFDGSDFVAGLLGTAAIADAAITNAKIANLDAAKINTGSLDAERIAANSISVGKLVVADPENLWTNPFFNNAAATVAQITNKLATDAGVPAGCPYASCGARDNSRDTPANDYYIFRQGDSFYMEAYVCTDGTAVQPLNLGVHITNNDGTVNSWVWGPNAPAGTTTWTKISGIVTPDATNAAAAFPTATRMRALVQVEGTTGTDCQGWFVTGVQFRRANTSELIVDGSIIASKLAVGAITAGSAVIADGAIGNAKISDLKVDKLTGGTLQSDINLAAKIEAGTSGLGLVQLDATGIRVIDGSGIQQTAFNTTGQSVFKGNIEAVGIEASGSVKLKGASNEVAVGASLYLGTGVTAPVNAPALTAVWDSIALSGRPYGSTMHGIAVDESTGKWYVLTADIDAGYKTTAHYILRYSNAGTYEALVFTQNYSAPSSSNVTGYYPISDATDDATIAVVNGVPWIPRVKATYVSASSYNYQMELVNSSGTTRSVGSVLNYTAATASIANNARCFIGNASATQVSMIYAPLSTTANTSTTVQLFNVSTGATASTFTRANVTDSRICYGNFDFGTPKYLIAVETNSMFGGMGIRTFTPAGVEDTASTFITGGSLYTYMSNSPAGIMYYSGNIYTAPYGSSTTVYKHSPITADCTFGYAWYDSKSAGTGTHETALSPTSATGGGLFVRANIRVTTAAFTPDSTDDGVDTVRIYGGVTGSTLYLQATVSTNQATFSAALASSGTTPGSGTPFPNSGDAGLIQNASGTIKIKGDGSIIATSATVNGALAAASMTSGGYTVLNTNTGLSKTITEMVSLSLNYYTSTGYYAQVDAGEATTGNNYPVAVIGLLEVIAYSSSYVMQRYTTFETNPRVYVRYYNGTTWGAWGPVNTSVGCRVTKTTAGPSIGTASTWAKWIGTTEAYDDANIYNTSTGVITIPTAGRWRITFSLPWSNFGSVYQRILGIFSGTAASGTPLATSSVQTLGRWHGSVTLEMGFAAGATLTTWIYATTTSSGAEAAAATTVPASSLVVVKL